MATTPIQRQCLQPSANLARSARRGVGRGARPGLGLATGGGQPGVAVLAAEDLDKSVLTIITIVTIAAAAALLSAGSVLAQEATPDSWMNAGLSGKTRAEVSTELAAARKSGLTKSWSAGYIEPVQSHLMRAQVKSATQQAIQSGEVKAINAEVYSFTPVTAQKLAQAGQ